MAIFPLRPTRQKVPENVQVVADLDKLISEPVAFRFQGKVHLIKPMDVKTFLKTCNELTRLDDLRSKKEIANKELIDAYANLFCAVCDTISIADVYEMTQAQVSALLQQILECVTGKGHLSGEKKTQLSPKIP